MSAIGQVVGGRGTIEEPAVGSVTIVNADNPDNPASVTAAQTRPPVIRPPQGRWQTIDRPGRVGLNVWSGQDPYEMRLRIRFDERPGGSVEGLVKLLESFAEVADGRTEPPVLTLTGSLARPRPNLKWRLVLIEDPEEESYLSDGKRRCLWTAWIMLRQHTTIRSLEESLRATKATKGLRTRTTRVRSNETDLFQVSRRYYDGDPSRASDIARANQLPLGTRLKVGKQLRMPV